MREKWLIAENVITLKQWKKIKQGLLYRKFAQSTIIKRYVYIKLIAM